MIVKINKQKIVVDESMQKLCCVPYYNHKHGCPNYNKKKGCPPNQPLINEVIDFNKDIFIIYTEFDIKSHVDRMAYKHPKWTKRQLYCCLYWQPKARKMHKEEIKNALQENRIPMKVVSCPEAHGVNVTKTMENIGSELEWFPKNIVKIVSFLGEETENGEIVY